MAEDFTEKVALVTGGGNGIGAATCRGFAAAGAQVAVLDRDAFVRLAEGITEAWGGIDILVNGAGTTVRRMIAEMGAQDWDRVIAVNLTGAFNGIRAVLPHMRARGGGAIVNVASIAGQRISFGGTANYTASKAGLLGLTRHAAYELAPDGIRVNAVCPGPTATGFSGANPTGDKSGAGAQNPAGPHVRARGHRRPHPVSGGSRRAHDHRGGVDRRWRRAGQERHPL